MQNGVGLKEQQREDGMFPCMHFSNLCPSAHYTLLLPTQPVAVQWGSPQNSILDCVPSIEKSWSSLCCILPSHRDSPRGGVRKVSYAKLILKGPSDKWCTLGSLYNFISWMPLSINNLIWQYRSKMMKMNSISTKDRHTAQQLK